MPTLSNKRTLICLCEDRKSLHSAVRNFFPVNYEIRFLDVLSLYKMNSTLVNFHNSFLQLLQDSSPDTGVLAFSYNCVPLLPYILSAGTPSPAQPQEGNVQKYGDLSLR